MNVLVTGANGFVGRALVRTLNEKGFRVRGTVRQCDGEEKYPDDGVEWLSVGNVGPATDCDTSHSVTNRGSGAGYSAITTGSELGVTRKLLNAVVRISDGAEIPLVPPGTPELRAISPEVRSVARRAVNTGSFPSPTKTVRS